MINTRGPLHKSSRGNHYEAQCNLSCAIWLPLIQLIKDTTCCVMRTFFSRGSENHFYPTRMSAWLPLNLFLSIVRIKFQVVIYSKDECHANYNRISSSALKCPTLSLPRNGVLLGCNTNNTEMSYDTECRFFCKEGSEAIGATIKRCAENGTWIGPDLVCPGTKDARYWYYQNSKEFKRFSLIFNCCIHCVAWRIDSRSSVLFPPNVCSNWRSR